MNALLANLFKQVIRFWKEIIRHKELWTRTRGLNYCKSLLKCFGRYWEKVFWCNAQRRNKEVNVIRGINLKWYLSREWRKYVTWR